MLLCESWPQGGKPVHRIILVMLVVWSAAAQAQQPGWGTITTIAGTGINGYGGDGSRAAQATFNFPIGRGDDEIFGHIALDASGNLYIADRGNHRIRRIDTAGNITTFAGTGVPGSGGDGGPATSATLNEPTGIAVGRNGVVYIADWGNDRVRRVDTNGTISSVAGTGRPGFGGDNGPASAAVLDGPAAVAVDAAGNIYIADEYNDRVRVIAADTGVIRTIAGNGQHGDSPNESGVPVPGPDNVPATDIRLGYPSGLLLDGAGNLFIADHHNNVVRVVNLTTGIIRRVAGNGGHNDNDPQGDEGPATAAPLGFPMGMALDSAGNLYFADMHNNAIRRVASPLSANAIITTPVGTGDHGFGGNSGFGWAATLDYPAGVVVDSASGIVFADWHNQMIRRAAAGITPPGPAISRGGVVNAASFLPGARVAPGSIVAIFGRRMAAGTGVADSIPLPRTLLNPAVSVTATVGSNTILMPLFFASPTQINAQMPVELPPFTTATIIARVGDRQSEPVAIDLSHSETGIFPCQPCGQNHALALNADGRLNTATEAAPRGTVITVFLTGQGELAPPVPTGQAAPLDPLSRSALEFRATIGGVNAVVQFLGATPTLVALSQANILVPDNAPTGDQPLVITVGGHDSNRPLITVR